MITLRAARGVITVENEQITALQQITDSARSQLPP